MNKQIIGVIPALFISITGAEEPELPPAEEIMASVAETYRAPQKHYMSGIFSAKLRQFPKAVEPSPAVIAVEFPDKLRMTDKLIRTPFLRCEYKKVLTCMSSKTRSRDTVCGFREAKMESS